MKKKELEQAPECIGVIVDGNRRWAKERNMVSIRGHEAGHKKLKEFVGWARDAGTKYVVAYVFSTENWNRSEQEVKGLMNLFRFVFNKEVKLFKEEGVRVQVVGQIERLDQDIQKMVEHVESETADMDRIHLFLAVSYGGRVEIVDTVNRLIQKGTPEVSEHSFAEALWTKDMPDPDMIIRTGGEYRLSNFLPWQSVYSELFFTSTLFPAFSKEEFFDMVEDFSVRERRHGK